MSVKPFDVSYDIDPKCLGYLLYSVLLDRIKYIRDNRYKKRLAKVMLNTKFWRAAITPK